MIKLRPFINTDPPAIVSIWASQPPIRGRIYQVTDAILEEHVFAKPFFDREGLIVAVDDNLPIGFVHAAFGPNESLNTVASDTGVICQLMVNPRWEDGSLGTKLLKAAEDYLASKGAKRIVAGGFKPNDPFYLGLYGGSRLPGVLTEEPKTIEQFRAAGYQNTRVQIIMQCLLSEFAPRIDRRQMMVKRKYQIETIPDPPPANWWEACTLGGHERTRFRLCDRGGTNECGEVTFWDMRPLSSNWGVRASGIFDLKVEEEFRRNGLATFMICEGIKYLAQHGVALAEVQTDASDTATISLFEKLRFQKVDEGLVLVKELA